MDSSSGIALMAKTDYSSIMRNTTSRTMRPEYLEWGATNTRQNFILLHGFPQQASTWKDVGEMLASRGNRVIAPNMRGYTKNFTPSHVSAYKLSTIVADIDALIDSCGIEKFVLIGHDWGGSTVWHYLASGRRQPVHAIVISMPHPRAFLRSLYSSAQVIRSFYVPLLMVPGFMERVLKRCPKLAEAQLRKMGLDAVRSKIYVSQLNSLPLGARGALNWYRALAFEPNIAFQGKISSTPVTFVWGDHDAAIGRRAAALTADEVSAAYRFIVLPNAGHWLPEMAAERIAEIALAGNSLEHSQPSRTHVLPHDGCSTSNDVT